VYDYNLQMQDFLSYSGVGVLCHEFFHSLGSPDLYHYQNVVLTPVGSWDLMAADKDPPQHMTAFMKWKYGHWISEIPTITAPGTFTLNPLTSATQNAYRIDSPHEDQYYIVEFRKKENNGIFESSIPGSGLIIYRIDARITNGNRDGPPDMLYVYRPDGTYDNNGLINSANYSAESGRTEIHAQTNPPPFLQPIPTEEILPSIDLYLHSVGSAAGSTIDFSLNILADPQPSISWYPPSITQYVPLGGSGSQALYIGNSGYQTLSYTLSKPAESQNKLYEGFAGTSIPTNWTQEKVVGDYDWTFRAGSASGSPGSAYEGSYNANLYRANQPATTKLITPALDLSAAVPGSAKLSFWHTQAQRLQGQTPIQDMLKVYYKTSSGGNWILLVEYTENIPDWREDVIDLLNPSEAYYIAFEGITVKGNGVCVDAVSVDIDVPIQVAWYTINSGDFDAGSINAGMPDHVISIDFDATGLAAGTYTSDMTLTSNCPTYPDLVIPVTLVVIDGDHPVMALSETAYDYGLAFAGGSNCTPRSFTATNIGWGNLTIAVQPTLTGENASEFTLLDDANSYPLDLDTDGSASWTVKFNPASYGAKTAYLTIDDNRGETAIYTIVPATSTSQGSVESGSRKGSGRSYQDPPYPEDESEIAYVQTRISNNIELQGFGVEGVFEDYFEAYDNFVLTFAPWTQFDGYGSPTYKLFTNIVLPIDSYIGSYTIFNPSDIDPPLDSTYDFLLPYSGDKYAACLDAKYVQPNDDWLISPQLTFAEDPRISFFARSPKDNYGLERFKVIYSTAGNDPQESYWQYLAGSASSYIIVPTKWTLYEYALPPDCAEASVHIAIHCVSYDAIMLMVDDFVAGDRGGGTVPVLLTSFIATINPSNRVMLTWVTQSETNCLGYYVYRGEDEDLAKAEHLQTLIEATNTSQQQTYVFTDTDLDSSGLYYYWLESLNLDGTNTHFGPIYIHYNGLDGLHTPQIPLITELIGCFPNPFNPHTQIRYSLERSGEVEIDIYNVRGQVVRRFAMSHDGPGYFNQLWDGRDARGREVASGVYLYRMRTAGFEALKRMFLMK
ncbi:MAG: choice-of-anchor J domain-containing protein, partial [Candidatus Syntrophosphaera sp.]|nr:choice-of-anchor J domain-containing protein [Candidatus Syntrophosphaera sp.]